MAKRSIGQPIRVLIAEDSRSQRELLVGLLRAGGMDIAGTVVDGYAAVAETRRLRPDVIAMDIHMPGLDGYAATRQIMQSCPTPIVLISSAGDTPQRTVAALAAGALTVVRKPGGGADPAQASDRAAFLTTMRLMADVLVVTRRPDPPPDRSTQADPPVHADHRPFDASPRILAIAASTGGPAAVQTLLNGLGAAFPLPILLAQHIARGFVAPLAEWLSATTCLPVRVAAPNERLLPGQVYLAPDDQHISMFVRDYAAFRPSLPADRYCPSADALFESIAAVYGRRAIGVILTGMGDDGARGLLALRSAGGRTLAQDEASCVVYGMPRVAVDLGAAERVAPLDELARAIRELISMGDSDGIAI